MVRRWYVILIVGAGGCVVHRPGPGGAAGTEVSYTLERLAGPPAAVRVTLCAPGEADGTSRLAIEPEWGGVEHCERFVHALSVRDRAGRACKVTIDPAASNVWTVSHAPGAELIATYELRAAVPDALADFRTHYEPVVRDDLLHLIGHTGLVYPEWLASPGPIDIRLEWVGFDRPSWATTSSFDAQGGRIRCTLEQFRNALFYAGAIRVQDREIRGGRLRVAIYGDDWGFDDSELTDLVEKIVTVEREFMGDFGDPYFLVSVVPTGPRATPESFSMGGTGLSNCFALFLPPGTEVGPSSPHRGQLLRLLAHEYFHTWTGGKIALAEPEELAYWFSEGFTDFYASRLLRRGGLIDDAAWAARMNETLKKLWLNPAATQPATAIQRDFWKRPEVQQLPYQRGEVVALMIDEEIRRSSGGRKSLDDFMRELLADAGKRERAETDRLRTRIGRWTSPAFAESIRRVVVDGALPDPPSRISDPPAVRSEVQTHRYDPGFDVDASLAAKTARGVREGSAAWRAGLREGQVIVGFDVARGDPDRRVRLRIRDGESTKRIEFLPRGEALRAPLYRLEAPNEASRRSD